MIGVGASFSRPCNNSSSIKNIAVTRSPPTFLISVAAEADVPPVANKSSIKNNSLAPRNGVDVQFHFCFAMLQRILRAFGLERQPAFLSQRHKTNSQIVGDRRAEEKSARVDPDNLVDRFPRHCSRKRSTEARKSSPSFKIGVMSLKTIPFFGKSGTSRTPERSFSILSGAIGANASEAGGKGQCAVILPTEPRDSRLGVRWTGRF